MTLTPKEPIAVFFKCMGFKEEPTINSVTEYGLYCRVPTWTLYSMEKTTAWEKEYLPKTEKAILSDNGPTLIAVYKAKRYSFPRRLLIQPKRLIMYLFVAGIWLSDFWEGWKRA